MNKEDDESMAKKDIEKIKQNGEYIELEIVISERKIDNQYKRTWKR